MSHSVSKNISDYAYHAFLNVIIWLPLSASLSFLFYHYKKGIYDFLGSLFHVEKFIPAIQSDYKYFLAGGIFYLLFLGHIKHKKGLIFGDEWQQGSYAHLVLMLFNAFNTIIFPFYIWYLCARYFDSFNPLNLQSILFVGLFIFLNLALLDRFQNRIFRNKFLLASVALGIFWLVWHSATSQGYFEMLALFLVGGVLNVVTSGLLSLYGIISSNYSDLTMVQEMLPQLKNMLSKDNIGKEIPGIIDSGWTDKAKIFASWFILRLNHYILLVSFVFAFAVVPVGIAENFNLVTILYIHFSFVLFYLRFAILSNKFPPIVNLCLDGKLFKNVFLAESSKEKVVFIDYDSAFVASPKDVSYIEIIRTSSTSLT